MTKNPLIQAYKKPAVFISLPSGGKWYDPKPNLSVDNEIAVYPMSAKDELITKTPDALFNGEATVSLLESCVPDIENPRQIPVSDLLVLMIAIRQASYGSKLDVDLTCPECKMLNQLAIDSGRLLSSSKEVDSEDSIKLENGFKITVKPYNLEDRTLLQLQSIKQQKMLRDLENDSLNDEERQRQFGETFVSIAELTVQLIANCIVSVQIPDDKDVTDKDTILEWLQSITKKDYDLIRIKVENLSDPGLDNKFDAKCQDCGHEWSTEIELDLANFFEG